MKYTQAATRTTGWRTHTHTEQAGWRRHKCTSWCSRKVCKHVRVRTNTRNMMPSHIFSHTSGWLSAQVQRRERTRDRRDVAHFPNNLPGPDCTSCISTRRGSPLHINSLCMQEYWEWHHFWYSYEGKKRFVWMLRSWKERMHMPSYIPKVKTLIWIISLKLELLGLSISVWMCWAPI